MWITGPKKKKRKKKRVSRKVSIPFFFFLLYVMSGDRGTCQRRCQNSEGFFFLALKKGKKKWRCSTSLKDESFACYKSGKWRSTARDADLLCTPFILFMRVTCLFSCLFVFWTLLCSLFFCLSYSRVFFAACFSHVPPPPPSRALKVLRLHVAAHLFTIASTPFLPLSLTLSLGHFIPISLKNTKSQPSFCKVELKKKKRGSGIKCPPHLL